MTTTRRAALGLFGVSSLAATGALAACTSKGQAIATQAKSALDRVPKGLRPGGELDKLLESKAARDEFSGNVLITYQGQTVLSRSHGLADKAKSVPIGPDTLFGLLSVAKLFTAVAVAQLAQRGKLNYLDTIGKHLTGFSAVVADHVTIHHLMTHTSGLGDFFGDPGFFEAARTWKTEQQQVDAMNRFVRNEKLAFTPGAGNQQTGHPNRWRRRLIHACFDPKRNRHRGHTRRRPAGPVVRYSSETIDGH